MPHPKFCNMLHADRATLLWQIRLSVCLSVCPSVYILFKSVKMRVIWPKTPCMDGSRDCTN